MKALVPVEHIERRISLIRGHRVMLDSDLANLYGVPTFRLNEQVKRNQRRFPGDVKFGVGRPRKAYLEGRQRRHHSSQRAYGHGMNPRARSRLFPMIQNQFCYNGSI